MKHERNVYKLDRRFAILVFIAVVESVYPMIPSRNLVVL
jgi:hypothetical protein